jgi:hypothetical protein
MYEIPTEELDLGEGQWAVLYKELKHGTRAAVEEVTRQYMRFADGSNEFKIKQGEGVKIPPGKTIVIDINKMDHVAINNIYILRQVKEWSFGEKVDELTLNEVPSRFTEAIIKRCHELYKGPLPDSGGKS